MVSSQVKNYSPGNIEQASSRGHEASPQSGLGVWWPLVKHWLTIFFGAAAPGEVHGSSLLVSLCIGTPSRRKAGAMRLVRRAGWVWAASGAPAEKKCMGWVYVRRRGA